ncbi:hypothetical protein PFISCL1PPCAC_26824, partial [Pristionchus fissidentatus]
AEQLGEGNRDIFVARSASESTKMTSLLSSSAESPSTTRMREFGHWSEVVSSAGKVYYYNRVTEQSQWIKPDGWEKAESIIFPVIDRLHRIKRSSDSGYTENDTVDFVPSDDDDMDVSDGLSSPSNSSIILSSSPASTSSRPPSAKENEEEEKEEKEEEKIEDPQEEEQSTPDKYYRPELLQQLRGRFLTDEMQATHTSRLASECAFEMEYNNQRMQMYRARALARTALAKAELFQGEVSALRSIQDQLEENRNRFQSNFHAEVRRLLRREDKTEEPEQRPESGAASITPRQEPGSDQGTHNETDHETSQQPCCSSASEPPAKKMRV